MILTLYQDGQDS